MTLLRDARQRGWLHAYQSELPEHYTTYIGFEGEAQSVWNYESLFVPGLLQIEDYARAVIRGGLPHASRDEVERRVEVRMDDRRYFQRQPAQPVEHRQRSRAPAPGRRSGSHAGAVRHLVEVSELPHVTFQVIPFGAGAHPGMPGSFILLQFGEAAIPDVIYVNTMAGELFLEEVAMFAGISSSSSISVQWPPARRLPVADSAAVAET